MKIKNRSADAMHLSSGWAGLLGKFFWAVNMAQKSQLQPPTVLRHRPVLSSARILLAPAVWLLGSDVVVAHSKDLTLRCLLLSVI